MGRDNGQVRASADLQEGDGARYGFPMNLMDRYIYRLIREDISITVVLEQNRYLSRIKERTPVYRCEPLKHGKAAMMPKAVTVEDKPRLQPH
jgi:NH3-dependent NAD+ synthetase